MDGVSIRNARISEVNVLIEFWSRAGENAARPGDRADAVERLIEHDPEALIVADLRGTGLGRRVLTVAEDRLRNLGAERFCAMVLDDNALGTSLWAASNYVQQDDWRRWVKAAP